MLKLYQIITILAAPLIKIYLLKRKAKGKEDPVRFQERLGYASLPRPNGNLVWVHAASAGESISVLPLIEKIFIAHPESKFLITTGTVNSAKVMANMLPKYVIHQYVPVDMLPCVHRFLNHWKPDIAIFVESEIWPNLVTQTSKYCPLVMVNGHVSEKSFNNWQKYGSFSKQIFSSFSACFAQSKIDADYISKLGAKNVINAGNIKYDAAPLPYDESKLNEISAVIGRRPIWLAASTHKENNDSEEVMVAKIHKEMKAKYPDLLTIIAPRHPARKDEILSELVEIGVNVAVRSMDNKIESTTDIYLADTMGELGIFYRIAPIVFIGGSLVPRGGHNPLEPARLGCAIIVGQYTFNFTEINREFIEKHAMIVASDAEILQIEVLDMLVNSEKVAKLAKAAGQVVQEKTGIIDNIVKGISPYIKK